MIGKKGQWTRMQANRNRKINRENRVLFTSYLMEKGYTDKEWLAKFWDMSISTIRKYKKEAKDIRLTEEDRKEIKRIQDKLNCSLPTAVKEYYLELKNEEGGCFIATAAYGTPFAEEIDILRRWRDNFLSESILGRALIKIYYSTSPPIANYIRKEDRLRKLVRVSLNPFVKLLNKIYSDK